jgi:hypothetical protein
MLLALSLLLDAGPGQGDHLRATLRWAQQALPKLSTIDVLDRGNTLKGIEQGASIPVRRLPCGLYDALDPHGRASDAVDQGLVLFLRAGLLLEARALTKATEYLHENPAVAAVTCVTEPGRLEMDAVLLRAGPLRQVGGWSRLLRGAAAGDDLAYRLWRAGFAVRQEPAWSALPIADLPQAVSPSRLRDRLHDELVVIERFLPRVMRSIYRREAWRRAVMTRRFTDGLDADLGPLRSAVAEARRWADWERKRGRLTLDGTTIERLFGWGRVKQIVAEASYRHGLRRVVLADWNRHTYTAYRAAKRNGLTVLAVADNAPQFRTAGYNYRRVPIHPDTEAITGQADGILVCDQHPLRAAARVEQLLRRFAGPVVMLTEPIAQEILPIAA